MTDTSQHALVMVAVALPLVAMLLALVTAARRIMVASGVISGAVGIAAGISALVDPSVANGWLVTDRVAGAYLCIVAIVCTMSCLVAPYYLARTGGSFFTPLRSARAFWAATFAFWAALMLLPVIANLGVAWLVVEATTAASAILVAHSGRDRALEAGWKYLMLTTLGLGVAFFAIVLMRLSPGNTTSVHDLDWHSLPATLAGMPHSAAVTAYVLVMVGLAAKIGWAPLHSWLPDAHSEAPAPISAMLSAALLPVVMLVAWRMHDAAQLALGDRIADAPFIIFGLVSLAVAVPFLWQPLAWKRLLAYSSLEHMGIIALGIAFGGRIAITGVILHVAGHALAKSLGFYASVPLMDASPDAARQRPRDLVDVAPATSAAMVISAATLAGLPPGPLFISELLIVLGGFQTGHAVAASALAILAALAFIGMLLPALSLLGLRDATTHATPPAPTERTRPIALGTGVIAAALILLTISGWLLADSSILDSVTRGIA